MSAAPVGIYDRSLSWDKAISHKSTESRIQEPKGYRKLRITNFFNPLTPCREYFLHLTNILILKIRKNHFQ